jgi:hypothetical protein
MTFDEWMIAVDNACLSLCGMSVHDLPDVCFSDMWEDDCTPRQAARAAIRAEMYGD